MVSETQKAVAKLRVNVEYNRYINGEFGSKALGQARYYESSVEDQINLIGAVLSDQDMDYRCSASKGGIRMVFAHTAAQIKQVFLDGVAYRRAGILKLTNLEAQIATADTQNELDAVKW